MMVTIANGPYVGAALTVAPDARLDDHRFDVEVFTRFGKCELLRHLLSIAWGRRGYNPKVQHFQAQTVEVIPDRPMMVHADSCPLATTPARFEVLPSALAVIVGGEPGCLPALATLPPPARPESEEVAGALSSDGAPGSGAVLAAPGA
jgi:diacylglycerol kinase family enzyme